MNDQLQQALVELCTKLGTSVEHLWGVLIKQAMLDGIANTFIIMVWTLFSIWSFKLIQRKTIFIDEDHPSDWKDEGKFMAWILWGIIVFIFLITICCSLPSIMSSFINPEYWALKQIIK